MTTLPPQPNFIHILSSISCDINGNRGCYHHAHRSSNLLLGDLPSQFTLRMTLTKASIKRGLKKNVVASFTKDDWYAVQLDEIEGNEHTVVFQMNPLYASEITTNRDKYQYEMLMNNLSSWDTPLQSLKAATLLQPRPSYTEIHKVETSFRKLYYDYLRNTSKPSFQRVLLFVANQYNLRSPRQPQIKQAEDTIIHQLRTECAKVLLGTKSYYNPHEDPVDFHLALSRNLK